MVRHHSGSYTWEGVDVHPYKETGDHFKSITRQTLLMTSHDLSCEFRYFEIGPGGHSTLERHDHSHAVMVIRGSGQVLVGDTISEIQMHDIVHVPPQTWHQFRATKDEPLGFLCVVRTDRDRPERPTEDTLAELKGNEAVAEYIRA